MRWAIALALAACGRVGFAPIGGVLPGGDGGGSGDSGGRGDSGIDSPIACSIALGAGRQHTTVIGSDGNVRVWGYGMNGQIGDGFMLDRPSPTPVALPARVRHANGGRFETCAALETGQAQCWGEGTSGQLGNGAAASSPTPVPVSNLTTAVEVAPAAVHACARLGSGEVWCWGSGANGRLGTGNTANSNVPVKVTGITTARTIAAGGSTTCAILADDTLRCWGYNLDGECGNNTLTDQPSAIEPIGIGTVRSVAPRDNATCAVRSDGAVMCWGANTLGQCGTGMTSANVLVPTQVVTQAGPLVGADEVGKGIEHGCARLGTTVWCWGQNTNGQLGDGNVNAGHPYATQVIGLPPVYSLVVGAYTNCAIDAAGGVWCWGLGMNGELGGGTIKATQPTPVLSFAGCP